MIPPTRPQSELAPTAVLRISVGNISAVYTNTIAKLAVAPNFPIRDRVIWKHSCRKTLSKLSSVSQHSEMGPT